MQTFSITPEMMTDLTRRRGHLHPYERLEAKTTALLVVDMQNYFMADGEPACCPEARDIVPNVNALAAALRDAGGMVVWIVTEAKEETPMDWANLYEAYSPEAKALRQTNLAEDGSGFPLWPTLATDPADAVIVKTRYSAFIQGSSDVESQLRRRGIDTVLVAGVATNVCCDSTARDAMMRGFRTVMIADANAAFTQDGHETALRNFLVVFGDVQTTEQALANLRRHSAKNAAA